MSTTFNLLQKNTNSLDLWNTNPSAILYWTAVMFAVVRNLNKIDLKILGILLNVNRRKVFPKSSVFFSSREVTHIARPFE